VLYRINVSELIEALGELPVRQCFTVDALHNQRETAAAIMEANHDYLMAVKENQPSLYKAIEKRALSMVRRGGFRTVPQARCL
jgi:predicted transposase YbfD/YdcC